MAEIARLWRELIGSGPRPETFLIDTTDPGVTDPEIRLIGEAMQHAIDRTISYARILYGDTASLFDNYEGAERYHLTQGLCHQAVDYALNYLKTHPEAEQLFKNYYRFVSRRYGDTQIVHELGVIEAINGMWYAFSPANLVPNPQVYDRGRHVITGNSIKELTGNITTVEPDLFDWGLERILMPF